MYTCNGRRKHFNQCLQPLVVENLCEILVPSFLEPRDGLLLADPLPLPHLVTRYKVSADAQGERKVSDGKSKRKHASMANGTHDRNWKLHVRNRGSLTLFVLILRLETRSPARFMTT